MDPIGPNDAIWHYDGVNALRHHPRIAWDAHGFRLDWETGRSGPHRWRLLDPLNPGAGVALFALRGQPGWRLGFDAPLPAGFADHLPVAGRYGRLIDGMGLWRAVAICAVAAAALLFVIMQIPGWVAPLVPRSWENALGDAMVGDFGGRLCETPASRAALERLTGQLAQGTELRQVAIAHVPMMNAVTLPGGRILIFDGLIQKAQTPDELAGVLAHEIGHVRHRDTVNALIRQLGLSVVLGGLDGNVGGALNGLLAMSYSRDAERAADGFSIAALRQADVSPVATARFFDRLGRMAGGEKMERLTGWMASHPVSADREQAFSGSAVKGHAYRPALDAKQWAALRNACRDDPDLDRTPSRFDLRF